MTAAEPREQIGPYRIVARVGAGGMGEVFKAWDPRLERDVAIKLLHPEMAADPDRQRDCWPKAAPRARSIIPTSCASTTPTSTARRTTSSRNGSKASRCAMSCRAGRCR